MDAVKHMKQSDRMESARIREENLRMRPYYDPDGMRRLMSIMCLGAIRDWKRADADLKLIEMGRTRFRGPYLEDKKRNAERLKKECEEFFNSDIFYGMTGMEDELDTIMKIRNIPLQQLAEIERRN